MGEFPGKPRGLAGLKAGHGGSRWLPDGHCRETLCERGLGKGLEAGGTCLPRGGHRRVFLPTPAGKSPHQKGGAQAAATTSPGGLLPSTSPRAPHPDLPRAPATTIFPPAVPPGVGAWQTRVGFGSHLLLTTRTPRPGWGTDSPKPPSMRRASEATPRSRPGSLRKQGWGGRGLRRTDPKTKSSRPWSPGNHAPEHKPRGGGQQQAPPGGHQPRRSSTASRVENDGRWEILYAQPQGG